jgi:hypothetical protein
MIVAQIPPGVVEAHDQIMLALVAVLVTSTAGLVYVIKAYMQAKDASPDPDQAGGVERAHRRLAEQG